MVMARPDILVQAPLVRKDLWERIVREPSDILIISQSLLPKPLKAKFEELQKMPDSPAVMVLSDSADPKLQAQLMAEGCDAVLHTGLAVEQLLAVVEPMLEKRQRLLPKLFFATQPLAAPRLADFVSQSPGMAAFMNVVPRVVRSDTTLLIEGETGVGKERLASAIHTEGPRSAGRFVALNCGALPEHLLESELFGHVRGAFTGATSARRGWFEIAHKGTLFLDEVSEIPIHLQVKLLRVLQEQEIQPVGGEKSFKVDVRMIAACNRPLVPEIDAGRFRRDLYHRLSVVTVTVPPLRDRAEDIPALVERQIAYRAVELGREVHGIHPLAMQALCRYKWPGNVRELNNVVERAILLCDDSEITWADLPESITDTLGVPVERETSARHTSLPAVTTAPATDPVANEAASNLLRLPEHWLSKPLNEMRSLFIFDLERQYIEGLLMATRGRVGEAAKRAGLPERSLYEKMQLYNLRKEDFRQGADDKEADAIKEQGLPAAVPTDPKKTQ
ncbi:MAG TPA: sigma-54 dependent transcriptional regulator [Planctomycetota bacterium]|nr:sigma-54 dependent transcriptional regulator [Planctomycetota bacterium]